MNKRSHLIVATLCVALLAVSGCQKSNESESTSSGADSGLPASLFLAEAPTGVAPIATLKETAREGDTVTVRAIVGGKLKAYVTDRAVMTVIDVSVDNPCVSDDDHCHTPWDYCCNARRNDWRTWLRCRSSMPTVDRWPSIWAASSRSRR